MEVLGALAVACNVTQLIEQCFTVAKEIKQIYEEGNTKSHGDIYRHSQTLQDLLRDFHAQSGGSAVPAHSKIHKRIEDIASQCEKIALELCSELDKLKSSGGHRNAVLVGLRTYRKRTVIKKLQENLQQQKELFRTGVLVTLQDEVRGQALLNKKQYDDFTDMLKLFAQSNDANSDKLRALTSSLLTQVEQSQRDLEGHIDKQFQALRTTAESGELKASLMQSLSFPEMNTRINQIDENEEGTFEWIFTPPEKDHDSRKWPTFSDWLSSGKRLYWIQGKAGSGKSTLMKFLWDHPYTEELLTTSQAQKDCCILRYSFWLSGSPQQRSVDGCYRSLLHQLLARSDDNVDLVLQKYPRFVSKRHGGDWSVTDLQSILVDLIGDLSQAMTLCVFVDGLDEIDGRDKYPSFVKLLRNLAVISNVKACVSSRPESYWCNQFANDPQIRLQDLVEGDIQKFVENRLREAGYAGFEDEPETANIVYTICYKAEGVFLWVHLAMRSIAQALDGQASWKEVYDLINAMPSGIADLYESMLMKQGLSTKQTRQEAALYFKVCLSGTLPHIGDFANFKSKIDGKLFFSHDFKLDDLYNTATMLRTRIPHICAGMVVCQKRNIPFNESQRTPFDFNVNLFHRTVKDFLIDFQAGKALLRECCFTDDVLLHTLVQGRANYAFVVNDHFVPENLAGCMMEITHLKNDEILSISHEAVVHSLKSLDGLFSHDADSRTAIGAEQAQDQLSGQQLKIFSEEPEGTHILRYPPRIGSQMRFCIDIPGLSIAEGVNDYVESLLTDYLVAKPPLSITLSASYKNYLVFCAIKSLADRHTTCIRTVVSLIEAGADPFADLYLPTWLPKRRCAAAELVWMLYCQGAGLMAVDTASWALLLDRIITQQKESPMILFLGHSGLGFATSIDQFIKDNPDPIYSSSGKQIKHWVLIQTSINFHLEHISRCVHAALATNNQKCPPVYPPVQKITGSTWIHRTVNDSGHIKGSLVSLTAEESLPLRQTFEETYKELEAKQHAYEDANWRESDGTIVMLPDMDARLSQLYESRSAAESIDAEAFWKEQGYLIEDSDPKVSGQSINRFEVKSS